MDKRTTLAKNETFTEILISCLKNKTNAAMLLDDNGLVRAEGIIQEIVLDTASPYLELTSGLKVSIKTIVAINGIFDPAYSEC